MRNLKKILALVLALVMSLSLMATASAADFKDASDISDNYQTAVSVLSQLEVFKGYAEDGTFRPQGEITRAEVATIIYRIATGDAKDAQASIYTNMTTSFTDLDKAEWARGYVNYCHNAQIIKGESATKFNPNGKITGYATLAMILRAMGYGRNGEFEGSQWEINTAAKAKEIGIIDNVMEAQLGSNAPRELVAEILFRALLTEMVDYTVLNGYVKNGKTLGYEHFKLEELEGVIVANEFANLYGTSVLANGKTKLEVAADDIRDLAVTTEITDIGMRQHVYITGSTVLDMDDTDLNKVTETGAATDISSASKFASTADMSQNAETEFYINFSTAGYNSSDVRIEYEMSIWANADQIKAFNDEIARVNPSSVTNANVNSSTTTAYAWFTIGSTGTRYVSVNANAEPVNGQNTIYNYVFHRVIPVCAASALANTPASQISAFDMDNIRSIFYRSNGRDWGTNEDKTTNSTYVGRVYVRTQTSKDISDDISYNEFVDTFINDTVYENNWNRSTNGEWVKFIDNNLDGVCDYAFRTWYYMDEAANTYTKGDKTYLEYTSGNSEEAVSNDPIRYMNDYTPAVGDVVLAAPIDGQILVEKANDVTKTVNNYNWRDDKITTTDGDEYGQSGTGIINLTGMQQLIRNMADKTEYIMYFDHFGYVRAYELPGGTQYALLTEIYAQNNATGSVIQNWPMTVELKAGEDATAEYNLGSGSTSEFVASGNAWTEVQNIVNAGNYYNWLQPAIAHLGVTRTVNNTALGPVRATPSFTGTSYQFWPAWRQVVRGGIVPGVTSNGTVSQEFNYGTQYIGSNNQRQDNTVSFTNVGVVNINDKTAVVKGAAQLRLNQQGNPIYWADGSARYSVDYVQLTRNDVAAKSTMYPISANYVGHSNGFVNATHDTEFYIVHNNGVEYFKDYVNMPKLTDEDNYIHAAYAVARDTSNDSARVPYWVADVIVYEVRDYNDLAKTNISLAYFNESRTSDQVQLLKTLTNAKNGPMADLTPALLNNSTLAWGADRGSFGDYAGYGFYQLWNGTEVTDGAMSARRINKIENKASTDREFNKHGIYAGYVDRVVEVGPKGSYLTIKAIDSTNTANMTSYSVAVTDNVYTITKGTQLGGGNYNEANQIRYTNLGSNQVHAGDLVIWQGTAPDSANWINAAYIVDLGNTVNADGNWSIFQNTADFLMAYTMTGTTRTYPIDPRSATGSFAQDGLWNQIVWEQLQANPNTTYKVTVERILSDNGNNITTKFSDVTLAGSITNNTSAIFNLLTVGENGYTPVRFETATVGCSLDVAGGTINDVGGTTYTKQTASAGTPAIAVNATPATALTKANLEVPSTNQDNVKVTITYVATGYTVTGVAKTGNAYNGISTITAQDTTTNSAVADVYGRTTAATVGAGLGSAHVGDNIRLDITLDRAFDASAEDLVVRVSWDNGTTWEDLVDSINPGETACFVNFTMKAANAQISAEIVKKPTTISVIDAAIAPASAQIGSVTFTNATATSAGAWTATSRWTAAPSVVVTAKTGYTLGAPVVKAAGVTMTNGTDYNWTAGTGTIAFVLGQGCDNKAVTIEFPAATPNTTAVTFTNADNVSSSFRVNLPSSVNESALNVANFNGAPVAADGSSTVTLNPGDVIYLLVVNGGNPTATNAESVETVMNDGSNVIWKITPDGTGNAMAVAVTKLG